MNNKIEVKDLINVGIFSALYFVCVMAVAMLGYIPIFMVLLPLIGPIIGGIPFMLFVTKINKFGLVTIMSIIVTLIMVVMGHPYIVFIFGIVFGIISDLILKIGCYRKTVTTIIGYSIFSQWLLGALISFFFGFRESYFASMIDGYGEIYVNKLMALTPDWLFFAMILMILIGGVIGSLIGKKVLKKHFIKAGIV